MAKQPERTLGQVLDEARIAAGFSLQQLGQAADIPKPSVGRLVRDVPKRPNPEHLVRLASVLELPVAELFRLAKIPVPERLASVETLLRAHYDLPEAGVQEVKAQIEAIVRKYQNPKPTKSRKEGKK